MRLQILAFLDEYCRGMTLRDVREWYADVFPDAMVSALHADGMCLNTP